MYLIYACYFATEGILYPFWPTWLRSLGYDSGEIGWFIAAAYWPQVLVGLATTYLADRHFHQLRVAGLAAATATLCMFLFYGPVSAQSILVLCILYGGLWASVLPLSEASLLAMDGAAQKDYGRVRALGSLSFILFSVLGGLLLGRLGQSLVPGLIGALMCLTMLACLRTARATMTPHNACRVSVERAPPAARLRLLTLLPAPLTSALLAAGLIQLSHCLYFAVASNGWLAQGYTSTAVGAFWAIAVIAEVSYFALSGRLLRHFSAQSIIVLSALFAALRWLLFAWSGPLPAIVLAQLLHALSFAAYHSALMRLIRDHAPANARNLLQGIYYSIAVALPMGIATPLASHLYLRDPHMAYLYMALLAAGGGAVALFALCRNQPAGNSR